MNGKEKCKILKELRQEIARNNDIEYAVSECRHKGDCKGTCPKCEEEVRYLEKELDKRRKSGKPVFLKNLKVLSFDGALGCCAALWNIFHWDFGNMDGDLYDPDDITPDNRDERPKMKLVDSGKTPEYMGHMRAPFDWEKDDI